MLLTVHSTDPGTVYKRHGCCEEHIMCNGLGRKLGDINRPAVPVMVFWLMSCLLVLTCLSGEPLLEFHLSCMHPVVGCPI